MKGKASEFPTGATTASASVPHVSRLSGGHLVRVGWVGGRAWAGTEQLRVPAVSEGPTRWWEMRRRGCRCADLSREFGFVPGTVEEARPAKHQEALIMFLL